MQSTRLIDEILTRFRCQNQVEIWSFDFVIRNRHQNLIEIWSIMLRWSGAHSELTWEFSWFLVYVQTYLKLDFEIWSISVKLFKSTSKSDRNPVEIVSISVNPVWTIPEILFSPYMQLAAKIICEWECSINDLMDSVLTQNRRRNEVYIWSIENSRLLFWIQNRCQILF